MAFNKCSKCGSDFIEVKEQNYGNYLVPVLKCTMCDTVFGVVNQKEEIEQLKNEIQNKDREIATTLQTYGKAINQIHEDLNKLQNK
ncbi:hypothetical protein LGK95_20060 [Clostridium algoriphilum]|uniref:hypothetical protein n=1 Tax=Clostridium algoriphilum TaxID=198347 RepID=UPI001CF1BA4C|nr:hypothetical protein [Clostridium algoriphilum]MCB2295773.1 hypothetical protein [Clostridium algoriphilum]